MIAAIGENNELGFQDRLCHKDGDDMTRFREKTMAHCILMGRRTFDSCGGPLKGRTNIVVTSKSEKMKADKKYSGVIFVSDCAAGVNVARDLGEGELFVIGGASIFEQLFNMTDKLYLTHFHESFKHDCVFPFVSFHDWSIETDHGYVKKANSVDYNFCDYVRNVDERYVQFPALIV